jgi:hypothetical protein
MPTLTAFILRQDWCIPSNGVRGKRPSYRRAGCYAEADQYCDAIRHQIATEDAGKLELFVNIFEIEADLNLWWELNDRNGPISHHADTR